MSSVKPANRRRSSSVTTALKQIPLNQQTQGHTSGSSTPASNSEVKPLRGSTRPRRSPDALPETYESLGFLKDVQTGRWMLVPSSAFKLMLLPDIFYFSFHFLQNQGYLSKDTTNPFEPLLWLSNKLPNGSYTKGWGDILFVLNHVIFWSFVRQTVTIHFLRPLAKYLGIRGQKIMRFTEQGYAIFYMGIAGCCGIYVMHGLPTWWYKTEHFWLEYPHREMSFELKLYYLMQFSYWLQQTIILAAKVEKPRKDFRELVMHHMVTLWLIGWSYGLYLTYIGVSIFVTMDISDVFLALAKCVNYVDEGASAPVFAVFVGVWTYFRHYLNIRVLWSVYTQFDLIPEQYRTRFAPLDDQWMDWWMKWQIFVPIFLLQCINVFWYFLILRILYRAVVVKTIADERSDDEGEEETSDKVKAE
ncbi:putative phingosine N-acyltransferase protein [Naematelia encephala]|uniref:Putative phingosine N-acyltransferase protein n=1 Tax=Naematelia encephala TaxID=71784 RepID=A0A1Y2BKY0_9TREE|nr:putative phingosine N-acyltransferase protein [Naematelia encephala]